MEQTAQPQPKNQQAEQVAKDTYSKKIKHKLWSIAVKNSIFASVFLLLLIISFSSILLILTKQGSNILTEVVFAPLTLVPYLIIFLIYFYVSLLVTESYPTAGKILSFIWITLTTVAALILTGFTIYFAFLTINNNLDFQTLALIPFLLITLSKDSPLLLGTILIAFFSSPLFLFNYTFLKLFSINEYSITSQNQVVPQAESWEIEAKLKENRKFFIFRLYYFVLSIMLFLPSIFWLVDSLTRRSNITVLPFPGLIVAGFLFLISYKIKNNSQQAIFLIKIFLTFFYTAHLILIPFTIFNEFIFSVIGSLFVTLPFNIVMVVSYQKIKKEINNLDENSGNSGPISNQNQQTSNSDPRFPTLGTQNTLKTSLQKYKKQG